TLNEIQDQSGGPNFHRCGPFAHIGIAKNHVKATITAGVHMRLIARVDQWATIHGIDAHDHAEKISALRNLIDSWVTLAALAFDRQYARDGENLASDKKR